MYKMHKSFTLVLCIYIFYFICSFTDVILPTNIFNAFFSLLLLILCFIVNSKRIFNNLSFICAIFYCFFLFLAVLDHKLSGFGVRDGGITTAIIELSNILPAVAASAILLNERNEALFFSIRKSFLIALCLSFVFVIPPCVIDNTIARRLSYCDATELGGNVRYFHGWYWGYNMLHVFSIFFPILVGLAHHCYGYYRNYFVILSIIILFITLRLAITTMVIYILTTLPVLACIMYEKYRLHIIFSVTILIIAIIFNIDLILDGLLEIYQGTNMEPKIIDFANMINGREQVYDSFSSRAEFQSNALNAFCNSPIIGEEYTGGGHSVILNRFGTAGICGGVTFVLILYFQFKQWYRKIPSIARPYFLLSWLGALILLYMKNCFGLEGFLFVSIIIPVMCSFMTHHSPQLHKP